MPITGTQNGKRVIFSQAAPTQARDRILWMPLDGSNNPIDGLMNWWNGSAWVKFTVVSSKFFATEHFLNTIPTSTTTPIGVLGLTLSLSGANAGASNTATTDRLGVATLNTGTTVTGRATYPNAIGSINGSGSALFTFECDFQIPTSTNATETFTVALGFLSSITTYATTANGCFLMTDQSNFILVNRMSSSTTQTTLGVLDNAWHNYKVSFNATSAIHIFDGASTTIATNLPLSTSLATIATIVKSAGTTGRTLSLDFMSLRVD